MTLLSALSVFNYGLVLIYGLILSVEIAGGCRTARQKHIFIALAPLFLLIQTPCWLMLGVSTVKQLYPLIVHLPLTLALIFVLKKRVGEAVVCTCTAYLCCQLPRWVNIAITAVTGSALAGEICYTLSIVPFLLLLRRCFVGAAHDAMSDSLLLFGSLPVVYYLFDYATTIYSDALYVGIYAFDEFLPTVLIAFYVAFMTAYHAQSRARMQSDMQNAVLQSALRQSQSEMDALRRAETQTAVYQHDMRHHLNMIDSLLAAGRTQQAAEYIRRVRSDIEAVAPRRFCANDTVNLLCSSFATRAERMGVRLTVEAKLPDRLSLPDNELCSVLSNGLENALRAAAEQDETRREVTLYCGMRRNRLLISITNPCGKSLVLHGGLPASQRGEGHGFGCRSIQAIAQGHGGLCEFRAENGTFEMRFMVPLKDEKNENQQKPVCR